MAEFKRLRRSRSDRMIAGVCGGLADFFGLSPTSVRIVYALVSILSVAFPGLIVYLILWLLVPEEAKLL
ncbi:MAG TPA: PspC domain-containing protein [Phycisphaerae bacterium]|nr:PspC domain-containing protein [Phycisphaerae bacterium]